MESRRMSTRSSRRATPLPVSPLKQAVAANVIGAGKAKRSSRKVLADKTNAAPVAAVPSKSPMKAAAAQQASTPRRKLLPAEQLPETPVTKGDELLRSLVHRNLSITETPNVAASLILPPVEQLPETPVTKGEELLRSLVHSNLSITETPNVAASLTTETETPQFGVPLYPHQDDAPSPSPVKSEVTTVSARLSSEWVGCDVDEVTEVGDGNDSDCSVLVNVSSPGLHSAASPAPASLPPTTPQTADFKWQRRDSLKVKEPEVGECGFNYYEDECEDYDEYDGEDFGQVIDCDEICQGISRIQVADQGLPEHKGRHIRFNYNSDDEVDVEEVDVMRLRGLPTPMGKHLRFPEDKDE